MTQPSKWNVSVLRTDCFGLKLPQLFTHVAGGGGSSKPIPTIGEAHWVLPLRLAPW